MPVRSRRPAPRQSPKEAKATRSIILTHSSDWGVLSAAVALRSDKAKSMNAEVVFASSRTLADTFQGLSSQPPGHVLVLGHSVPNPPEPLFDALEACKKAGWRTVWLGSPKFADAAWSTLGGRARLLLPAKAENLVHAVMVHGELEGDAWAGTIFEASLGTAKMSPDAKYARDLAAAMVERYWQFEDREAASRAVRALAAGRPDDREMDRIVAAFRLHGAVHLTGKSKVVNELRKKVRLVAQDGITRALILGETGTGKDVAARLLHLGSPRAVQPFLAVNCANLHGELLLSHLFGHERGAFTGATETRRGLFEQADGGTLLLDEVGELDARAQATLLRVLEEGKVRRIGGTKDIGVDVRILSATHRDLWARVREGAFREDLYFRLAPVTIPVPSLRERPEDIPFIAQEVFFSLWRERRDGKVPRLDRQAISALSAYTWPGNIRELENLLTTALVFDRLGDIPALVAEFAKAREGDRFSCSDGRSQAAMDNPAGDPHCGKPAGDLFTSPEVTLDDLIRGYLKWMLQRHATKAEVMRRAKVSQGLLKRNTE